MLLVLAAGVKIPCEYSSPTWEPDNKYRFSDREILVSTRYGFDMIVDAFDETVSRVIQEKGMWDSSIMHAVALFLKPGIRVLNLGSQTGLEAIIMGRIIGDKGQLYLFEPYGPSYAILKKNIYLNDLEDITTVYKVGASDVQAEQKILVFP
jgi:tRNA A58 N-methylase Trm61